MSRSFSKVKSVAIANNDNRDEDEVEWLDSYDRALASQSQSSLPTKRALSSAALASPLSFSSSRLQEELGRLRAMQPSAVKAKTRKDNQRGPYDDEEEDNPKSLMKLSSPRLPSTLSTHGIVVLSDSTLNPVLGNFRDRKRAMAIGKEGAAILDQLRAVDDLRQGQGQGQASPRESSHLPNNAAGVKGSGLGSGLWSPRVAPLNLSKISSPTPPTDEYSPSSSNPTSTNPISFSPRLSALPGTTNTSADFCRASAPAQESKFSLLPSIPGASPRGRMSHVRVVAMSHVRVVAPSAASEEGDNTNSPPIPLSRSSLSQGLMPQSPSVTQLSSNSQATGGLPSPSGPSSSSLSSRLRPKETQSFSCPSSPKGLFAKIAAMQKMPAEVGTMSAVGSYSREESYSSSKGEGIIMSPRSGNLRE